MTFMRQLSIPKISEKLFIDIEKMGSFIASVQRKNGEIPWTIGGKTNPWDHVESAMGLSTAGRIDEARMAFAWMKESQTKEGSWYTSYINGVPQDKTTDTNISSYIAVGVFHHYLITKDEKFLLDMWETVKSGISFAISLQTPSGSIYWAKNPDGVVDPMCLLTGSSSVYMSIKCALAIASVIGKRIQKWERALLLLGDAIKNKPHLFNMMKSRFSMDWYYPVLCGAISGDEARKRISKFWEKFVVPQWGVRCVSDQPWTTMAETSELVMALTSIDEFEKAETVFKWLDEKKYGDGSYWLGVTFPDNVIWPEDKTAWTTAAVLLAYDSLRQLTPGGLIFNHRFWNNMEGLNFKDSK